MPIADLHCDTLTELEKQCKELRQNDLNLDLKRMRQLGVVLQDFAIFVRMTEYGSIDDAWSYTKKLCTFFNSQMLANQDIVLPVKSYADVERALKENKTAAMLSLEEGGVLDEDVERVKELYDRGVRLITISWNFENTLGYPHSLTEDTTGLHLKPFGRKVVEAMNDLHMIVDVSHSGDGDFWDVAEMVKGPFVASHSDARAIEPHSRNLTDEMIREVAKHGGVVGINFFSKFLGHDGTGSMEQIITHFQHIKQVGGIDVLALGSDFDGFGGHSGVRTCEDYPKLISALTKAGFTDDEIDKLSHKNVLRVIKDVIG